jgi:ABC-type Fe3+/spermidine/putrescine transport system ATPase subunit
MTQHVAIEGVVKRFGPLTVLDGVSLSLPKGEFLTLLGPSGCGKTTLLRIVAGFLYQDAGAVRVAGKVIDAEPPHRRDFGMVFQHYAVFPHMSVFDNVAYGLRARGIGQDQIARKVAAALDRVRLGALAQRFPPQLSGGQKQRVGLARAIVIEPELLLMDEPLSNLDAKLRIEMRQEIRLLQRELGITTIYVTHDQEEALAVSDRIAVLERGHLLQIDVPRRVYEDPAHLFVADFIGGANKLAGRAAADGVRLDAGPAIGARLSVAPGAALTTTLRIEDLRIAPAAPDWLRLPARVVLASYLGARQRLACALADGTTIEADLDPGAAVPEPGGAIDLWFSPAQARIFDAADGRRVG